MIHADSAVPLAAGPVVDEDSLLRPVWGDVAALLNGELPPPALPSILGRTDGHCLFYTGEVNMVYGDPETGKTWLCLAALAETLRSDKRGVFIDLDGNGIVAIVHRLLDLGAPEEALKDPNRFRYARPEDSEHIDDIVSEIAPKGGKGASSLWVPDFAVIDSVGELIPLQGGSSNSADDYTAIMRPIADRMAAVGTGVVLIDHQAKNTESKNYGAGGTMAKLRRPGGSVIKVVAQQPPVPGRGGIIKLFSWKDRPGGVREQCPVGQKPAAGAFILEAADEDGMIAWRIEPPRQLGRGETVMQREARYLQTAQGLDQPFTLADVTAAVESVDKPTKTQRNQARALLDSLVSQGDLEVENEGGRGPGNGRRYKVC